MAFKAVTVEVFEGPDKWKILLGSLWEGKNVRFLLRGTNKVAVMGCEPEKHLHVRIGAMERQDNGRTPKQTHEWIIEGEILDNGGAPLGLVLRGTYNTLNRFGEFVITDRPYEGGDHFFGFREGNSLKGLIPISECVKFIS